MTTLLWNTYLNLSFSLFFFAKLSWTTFQKLSILTQPTAEMVEEVSDNTSPEKCTICDPPVSKACVSEWLLFNNCSAIPRREQVNFQCDNDEIRFVLDQHTELDFYSASSLKQQSVDRHVAPLGHIILIPSQPVFAFSP